MGASPTIGPVSLEQCKDLVSPAKEELEEVLRRRSQWSNFGCLLVCYEDYVVRAQGARSVTLKTRGKFSVGLRQSLPGKYCSYLVDPLLRRSVSDTGRSDMCSGQILSGEKGTGIKREEKKDTHSLAREGVSLSANTTKEPSI